MFRPNDRFLNNPVLFLITFINCIIIVHSSYKDDMSQTHSLQSDQHKNDDAFGDLFKDFAFTASTDESKLRLAFLVDEKMDRNKDGLVQLDELVSWLKESHDKYAQEDANRRWTVYQQQVDGRGTLGWKQYAGREFDHLLTIAKSSASPEQAKTIRESYDYHIQRDLRRWRAADSDQDGRLSRNEFKVFLYPENSEQMHWLVVEEKLELLDRDKDGKVSVEEFLSSLKPIQAHPDSKEQESWLRSEKSRFHTELDSNRDNYLDKSELAAWVTKSELNDHSISEAQQLMQAADSDHDHRLSKVEILAAYHDFVNSHATDFGEALKTHKQTTRDEL